MKKIEQILGVIRFPFLLLTPCCMSVGVATGFREVKTLDWVPIFLALFGGLCAHLSVNTFNEYFDYRNGLDSKTTRTLFSGGSGVLVQYPQMAPFALLLALGSLGITIGIGIFFLFKRGIGLLPIGLLGILTIFFYTPWITRHPWICLIAPGFGFGTCMVLGTHFVITGSYSLEALAGSFVPFFLVNDLLLLNQFPDVEPDREVGRRHFVIVFGRRKSALVYAVFLLLVYVWVLAGIFIGFFPKGTSLAFLTLPLALLTIRGVLKKVEDVSRLIPSMKINVILNLVTPVLFAVGYGMGDRRVHFFLNFQ